MQDRVGEMKVEKHETAISDSLLLGEPYTWLICTQLHGEGQISFYTIAEDRYRIRIFPELKNKLVACCYGGLLVLMDKSTYEYLILNILTMEKFELPHAPQMYHNYTSPCVLSSSKMDTSCRIIFFPPEKPDKVISCSVGDTKFIERDFPCDFSGSPITFNGKFYALTCPDFNLVAFDFSDPGLHPQQAVSGESIRYLNNFFCGQSEHLVESCKELLLIVRGIYEDDVYDVKIFRADFSLGKWVKLKTLGDVVVFLDCRYTISSPASACGLKGNAMYWSERKHLYMYDVEDQSITMKLPFPIAKTFSQINWVSFPITYWNEEKPSGNSVSEDCPVETTETMDLQVEERKTHNAEEMDTISSRNDSLWTNVPNELFLDISSRLFAGDRVALRSVCRSWYSVSSSVNIRRLGFPKKVLDCSSPYLMCSNYKLQSPIYGELHNTNFPDIPEGNIRAARYGWLLMQERYSNTLFFYNSSTKEKITLAHCDQICSYYSLCFSAPPTSADCLVVGCAVTWDDCYYICYVRCGDEEWKGREILKENEPFYFSFCNPVIYKGQYYFLGSGAKLLIYDPKKSKIHFRIAPDSVYRVIKNGGHQYMLESDDGKLIAVFVSKDGSSVYTCRWNVSKMKWDPLESLGNKMLFISRPLSFFQRATVRGTANKIYFPRVVGDNNILFYSLATKRYHTFESGTSYRNFFESKFYIKHNGCWFVP